MAKSKFNPGVWRTVRNRLFAGLFVLLPLVITFFLIYWLYERLINWVINPTSSWLLKVINPDGNQLPDYVVNYLAPTAAVFLIVGITIVAGMFLNSRLHRLVDWFLNSVPGVNMIYSVVSNVFEAIQRSQFGAEDFKRVVLVEFPHPGMKVPAFVTSETKDETTGEDILCVYVPTTPVPTSGYMLMVPESNVVALDWDLQETLQAIVSGGITAPARVRYYPTLAAEKRPELPKPNTQQ